jgi:MFS family permease
MSRQDSHHHPANHGSVVGPAPYHPWVTQEVTGNRSYRALLAIPQLGRVIVCMQLGRIAQSMTSVAMVLFTLSEYHSAALAGIVTFASLVPGILISPIAGALLDRHGRVRLIVLDYVLALISMVLVGGLSMLHALPPAMLVIISVVASLTGPFSQTGLRSLFPMMVPRHLWERVNALDSNGYLVATILGPPLAAAMVVLFGAQVAVIVIGVPYGLAAWALRPVAEPASQSLPSGRLLHDAWLGLTYTWHNATLRGLGFTITTFNIAGGISTIVIPLIVLRTLGASELAVGVAFAVAGVTGIVSVLFFGRLDSRGREKRMLVIPILLMTPVTALFLVANGQLGLAAPVLGFAVLIGAQAVAGLMTGPMDIALFTVRQRRTDPAMLGRAFAVSMAFNFMGFPIGAAIAGILADTSVDAAIAVAVVACLAAAAFGMSMVPTQAPDAHLPVRASDHSPPGVA